MLRIITDFLDRILLTRETRDFIKVNRAAERLMEAIEKKDAAAIETARHELIVLPLRYWKASD